jgi:hypothetical protein
MEEPNAEQVERGARALEPFVRRWSLPLDPEKLTWDSASPSAS